MSENASESVETAGKKNIDAKVQAPFRIFVSQLEALREISRREGLTVSELVAVMIDELLEMASYKPKTVTVTMEMPKAMAQWFADCNAGLVKVEGEGLTTGKPSFLQRQAAHSQPVQAAQLPSARALPSVGTPIVIDTSLPDAFGFRNSGV